MLDDVDRRLQQWARWVVGGGAGGLGYASLNWESLGGRTGGEAVIPTVAVEASADHDDVMRLPSELRRTVEVYYLGPTTSRVVLAAKLCCSTATVDARLTRAHRLLRDAFGERARRDGERTEAIRRQVQAARDAA